MAEKIVSPGVFTKEIDASFLPSAIGDIGAAIIGPTVKGPAMVPTVVTSYAEFQTKFGDTFKSGSNFYQYLTSHTAREYLKHADKLTIDAQSALRRCIELFSHTTRFFIIVEDKNKLLKPIISRFCNRSNFSRKLSGRHGVECRMLHRQS